MVDEFRGFVDIEFFHHVAGMFPDSFVADMTPGGDLFGAQTRGDHSYDFTLPHGELMAHYVIIVALLPEKAGYVFSPTPGEDARTYRYRNPSPFLLQTTRFRDTAPPCLI